MSKSQHTLFDSVEQSEVWKPVAIGDYGKGYSVSSLGRVRRDVGRTSTKAGRILKPRLMENGYFRIKLTWDGLRQYFPLHWVVCFTFHGQPPGPLGPGRDDYQCEHNDGNKANNSASNLLWVTMLENMRRAAAAGLLATGDRSGSRIHRDRMPRGDCHYSRREPQRLARGSRNGWAKLTESVVLSIRCEAANGISHTAIARKCGISITHVGRIVERKAWRHVG